MLNFQLVMQNNSLLNLKVHNFVNYKIYKKNIILYLKFKIKFVFFLSNEIFKETKKEKKALYKLKSKNK